MPLVRVAVTVCDRVAAPLPVMSVHVLPSVLCCHLVMALLAGPLHSSATLVFAPRPTTKSARGPGPVAQLVSR